MGVRTLDYDDKRDWQYREQHPGYEREIGLTAADLADCDPELAVLVAETYTRDNQKRRENNQQTRIDGLMALLRENGIEIPDDI